jgi:1-acyl-sn-glycerol-3-phosphate acyltransferase/acyl carrier protein
MITTGNGYLAGPRRLVLDPDSLREGRARDVADDRLGARELLSSGRALPGMAFAIVDSLTGIALADESVGEIWLAGPCVGLGYWGKPEDTRDIFHAFTAAREGPYLRSGDLGFRSGGEVFVVGRMKEVIILRGLKYYPDDLEATARAADERLSSAAAAAFGFEGPSGQEMLALAFEAVPIEDDAERQALASAIRRAVAASWAVQVSAIVFCAPGELPRTRTAKVQRTQCTSLLEKGAWHPVGGLLGVTGAAVAEAPQADLDALPLAEFADVLPGELARLFARRLGIRQDQMAPQHAIGDFGVDSMAVVQLGLDILNRFRVNLSAEDLRGEQTIAALSATILERRSKAAAKTSARTQDRRLRSVILGLCRRVTRTEISGLNNLPARGPAILAVNHVNSLDAPLLAGILPQERPLLIASAHLAARAFTDRPLRALFRPIYIDMNLALSFISALEALQQGEIVGIAPEGRLAIDGVLGEAKHGAAYLAAVSGAPVIPIAISGHVGWKRRLLSLKPLAVRIAFGRPMRFSGTGAGDLARNTEAIMHEIAAMLPAPYRGRYATPAFTPARHEVA